MELTALLKPLAGTTQTTTALVVLLMPLLAFILLIFFGKKLPRKGDWLGILITTLAFLVSTWLFSETWNTTTFHTRVNWFSIPALSGTVTNFTAGILLDNLAVLMLLIVTLISLLVQIFSVGYMKGDSGYSRYFAYLGLFTFSMLGIVLMDNLLLLFMFWELVGLSSYLLIGFWYKKNAAIAANKKAFLVNRIGDIGLLLGLFFFYTYFRTFDLETLRTILSTGSWVGDNFVVGFTWHAQPWLVSLSPTLLTLAGLGLFMGCVGKSAQFPLQVWLPDAMQGPTPVSSLIHAATMVAAGVYLLARCYAFFTVDALTVMAIIGAVTALLGALAALTQYDIKAVLAFSTISQLGYMVMGMGTGAHDASLFHLTTHAFFKAALFLIAGILIHAMHRGLHRAHQHTHIDAQNIRNMGGLKRAMPVTFYSYIFASAALAGIPLFSGFLSKDAILSVAWAWAQTMSSSGNYWSYIVPITGFVVVLLTAFYMARHMWFIFFGEFRAPIDIKSLRLSDRQEVERVMNFPVLLLAILSLGIFFSLNPLSFAGSWVVQGISLHNLLPVDALLAKQFIADVQLQDSANHMVHIVIGVVSAFLAMSGIALALGKYNKRTAEQLLNEQPSGTLANLSYNHFYLERVYNTLFVSPTLALAKVLYRVDKRIIDFSLDYSAKWLVVLSKVVSWFDKLIVDGLVWVLPGLSKGLGWIGSNLQNGKVQSYYAYSLFGLILIVFYIMLN